MQEKNKRVVKITRKAANKENQSGSSSQPTQESLSRTSGIILASDQKLETDPFKVELEQKGYIILSENEHGVCARKAQGKPTFLARTVNGYLEREKPCSLYLPESINTAMKVHIANKKMNAQEYILQLIMKDLKENKLL